MNDASTIASGTMVCICHDGRGPVEGPQKIALVAAIEANPKDATDVRYTLIVAPGGSGDQACPLEVQVVRPYQVHVSDNEMTRQSMAYYLERFGASEPPVADIDAITPQHARELVKQWAARFKVDTGVKPAKAVRQAPV